MSTLCVKCPTCREKFKLHLDDDGHMWGREFVPFAPTRWFPRLRALGRLLLSLVVGSLLLGCSGPDQCVAEIRAIGGVNERSHCYDGRVSLVTIKGEPYQVCQCREDAATGGGAGGSP